MQVLNIFHVLVAISLIAFVLIQKGQGATAGAAFGSGASGTVFGSRGASNFLTRATWVLSGLFCAISLTMAIYVSRMMDTPETGLGVVADGQPAVTETVPAENGETGESLFSAEDIPASDVPAIEPAADDLPAVDGSALESEAADDLPPVGGADEDEPEDPGNG
jgi:preprotein translocase subunit SecG